MSEKTNYIELLSPAKNLECGIAAIDHGADAVYIGAPKFGARAAVGNSIDDIAQLAEYAHQFRARVFVAMNTLLTDEQLDEAEKLIWEIYHAGADALIIQDMGILRMNLPPIELHASTQTDNRTIEKITFLKESGFSRVVLARELTLAEISAIKAACDVELEAFVHGALCVSYSGQCYISQAMCGRSANRGECAQYCRLPYQLIDSKGNILLKNKHLLSLKDLDQSDSLLEMMEAGVSSLKIEGRLKDIDYVKNITAYYRQKLDTIIQHHSMYKRASSGKIEFFFEPAPEKSFRRSATDYFLHGRHQSIIQPDTPKSMGEPIGKITYIGNGFFEIANSAVTLNNGDGLCFLNKSGNLNGFRANRIDGKKIFPAEMPVFSIGTFIYRNQDSHFDKIVKGKTAERRIDLDIIFGETAEGFSLTLTDEDNTQISLAINANKEESANNKKNSENIHKQLTKLGNTIFKVQNVKIDHSKSWFFPSSMLANWRREAVELLYNRRKEMIKTQLQSKNTLQKAQYPSGTLSYLGNVTNKNAFDFYSDAGVTSIEPGFEIKSKPDATLMFCKHCIKHELGWCHKTGNKTDLNEPLFLEKNGQRFKLHFDCKKCEMTISKG